MTYTIRVHVLCTIQLIYVACTYMYKDITQYHIVNGMYDNLDFYTHTGLCVLHTVVYVT